MIGARPPENGTKVILDQTARVHFQFDETVREFNLTHLVDLHPTKDSYSYYYNRSFPSAFVLTRPGKSLRLSLDFANGTEVFSENPIEFRFVDQSAGQKAIELVTRSDFKFLNGNLTTQSKEMIQPIESNESNQRFRIPFAQQTLIKFELILADNTSKVITVEFADLRSVPNRVTLQFENMSNRALLVSSNFRLRSLKCCFDFQLKFPNTLVTFHSPLSRTS